MSIQDLMLKAERACDSAKLLFEAGDTNGACDRAYYSMFSAARASLLASGVQEAEMPRSHSGLIALFGQRLIKTKKLPLELGKSLNKAEELRLIADYQLEDVSEHDAKWVLEQAQIFLKAAQGSF